MFNLVAPCITGNPNRAGNALTVSDGEWETDADGVVTHGYQCDLTTFPSLARPIPSTGCELMTSAMP